MDLKNLYACRIGGKSFGSNSGIFKFTLIDEAKKSFIRNHPDVKVIDMGVGEPEERAADNIVSTLYKAALKKENRIYPCNGGSAFKRAAARYLRRFIGIEVDPETEIVHCTGTKSALAQLPFAFLDPGDRLVATTPGYPVLPRVVEWMGGEVLNLKLLPAANFLPDLEELEEIVHLRKPKMVLLNYPNNPTGAVPDAAFYSRVIQLAHKYTFILIQDAAYADYVFKGDFCSPLQIKGGRECTIELYSLSKSYNMQGYRIGFVVSNPDLLSAYALVKDNLDNGQFLAVQEAAVEALDSSSAFLSENHEKYQRRLQRISGILQRAGLNAKASPGTFYLYFGVPARFRGETFKSAQDFSDYLISKLGVVSVPWSDAGEYIRLSMTFESGNSDFGSEEEVFAALEERLL